MDKFYPKDSEKGKEMAKKLRNLHQINGEVPQYIIYPFTIYSFKIRCIFLYNQGISNSYFN